MKLRPTRPQCFAYLGLLILAAFATANAQVKVQVTKELDWSLRENEIEFPQFSPNGNFVVLVTRVHRPDGDEAESLPGSVFKRLEQRQRQDPRFADPIIRLIDLKGNQVCQIQYGTSPALSPDNKSIVFSRQKKPITGFRPLAETLAGNDIETFDCEGKQARTIAEPQTGYLDAPFFLPDGKSIVYTINEAVNGAMGGPIGLKRMHFNGMKNELLLGKETSPAIPCPPPGSAKTNLRNFMCSQPRLSSSFSTLLIGFAVAGDQLVALQAKPAPSAGDMYLASYYALQLVPVLPKKTEKTLIQNADLNRFWHISMQATSDTTVRIFTEYWRAFSLESKDWLPDSTPQNTNYRSSYSPDGKYYLATEPADDEPTHVALYRTADGQKLFTSAAAQTVLSLAWSRDSKQFATVAVPDGTRALDYREVLAIYSMR